MNCVAVLAADTLMKPGAIVEYDQQAGDKSSVSLPVADLFATNFSGQRTCLIPGVDVTSIQEGLAQPQPISIPQMTYQVNRNLSVGADVEIPKLYGFTFKAGPKWDDVDRIYLANDDAWLIQLDELSAKNAYRSCRIKKSCADDIATAHYRVIGTAIIAKGINYKVYNKRGDLISLEAAAKSKEFTASVGGSSGIESTADSTIKALGNRVVGVRLLPTTVFAGDQACSEPVIFDPPTASSSVSIVGGGGKYSIGELRNQTKPIDETAVLTATGTEASECDAGFERKTSSAHAEARVDNAGPGAEKFTYKIQAAGGHYATAASCVLGQVIGKTGHDTTATAEAELSAVIYVILRSDSPPPLRVTYNDFPAGSNVRLVDWHSQPLQVIKQGLIKGDRVTTLENMPESVSGSGSEAFSTHGPGYYRLEAKFHLSSSVTGNSNDEKISTARACLQLGGLCMRTDQNQKRNIVLFAAPPVRRGFPNQLSSD